jgi:hypothetical protein
LAYLELAGIQRKLGIAPFDPIIGPYHSRPFTTINTQDAVAAALEKIEDEQVKALPVIGSVDQISDLTPVLENPVLSQKLVSQFPE